MANDHEEAARARKALNLAIHFRNRHITADDVAKMHPDVLAHHVGLAGVKTPSPETMAHLDRTLRRFEEDERRNPDPFAGLV